MRHKRAALDAALLLVREMDDGGSAGFQKGSKARFPCVNGRAHLMYVLELVVDRGDAADRPARMVEELLHDMRGGAELGKIGCEGSAEVVKPKLNAAAVAQSRRGLGPSIENGRGLSAHLLPRSRKQIAFAVGERGQNVSHRAGVGKLVLPSVLGESGGEGDGALGLVDPFPPKSRNFSSSLPCENEKENDRPVRIAGS